MSLVYILTEEPYHDNSSICGVYYVEKDALEKLEKAPNPENINGSDYLLTEWDTVQQCERRTWGMSGTQVMNESGEPIRKEYTFWGPEL